MQSWAAQRDARHDRLQHAQVQPDRPGRAAASAVTLIAVAVGGLAMTRAGPLAVAEWMPTVAGVLLATAALVPSLARWRGRRLTGAVPFARSPRGESKSWAALH